MRIGIDCRQIYDVEKNQGAGIERYVYNLVKSLLQQNSRHEFVLFFDDKVSERTIASLKRFKRFKVIKVKSRFPFLSNHVFFTFKLWAEFVHWMIFPANVMPFLYVGKSILVVHDVAIYNHPEWFPNQQWFSKLIVVPTSLIKATYIVTISQSTKEELLDILRLKNPRKIKVIYPGIKVKTDYSELATKEVLANFTNDKPFLFFVGTIEPRKNLETLFIAFESFVRKTKSAAELIVAGACGWKYRGIFSTLESINKKFSQPIIRYLGKISDREKEILMQHCQAFIFPSKFEGFGLPIFEAMACGAPVIASNNSAMAELINNQALKVKPGSIEDLFAAIKKILGDQELRLKLISRGRDLVKQFDWRQTSKQFLEIIELPKSKN